MSTKRFTSILTVCLLLGCLLAAGCTSGQTADPAGKPGEKVVAELKLPGGDWGLPSPFTFYPRGPGYVHMSFIYDTLTWKDDKQVIPWLAEDWQVSADRLSWTFKLRPGVKWQDGQPLTAQDVVFTFSYLKKHPVEWFDLGMIREVQARDEHTVIFTLKSPYAPFLQQVAGNIPIIPGHIWSKARDPRKEAKIEMLVGTGPYMLQSYDKAQGAYAYQANENFFLGAPGVKKLLFVPSGDKVALLERGDLDVGDIPASLVEKFKQNPKFKVVSGPSYWTLKLQFNLEKNPFNDPEVRQAIAYAINREELIKKSVPGGLAGARPGNPGFLPPESTWFNSETYKLYDYDINKAKELLKEAGIEDRDGDGVAEDQKGNRMQFTLLTPQAPQQFSREAENSKLMLRDIGFILDIKTLNLKTIDGMILSGNYDLSLNGHGGLGGDPATVMGFGIARGGMLTPGTPRDTAYQELAQKLLVTPDNSRRREICNEMQNMYARLLPCLPLYYSTWHFAYDPAAFDGWFYTTDGGIAIGLPMLYNKLALLGVPRT